MVCAEGYIFVAWIMSYFHACSSIFIKWFHYCWPRSFACYHRGSSFSTPKQVVLSLSGFWILLLILFILGYHNRFYTSDYWILSYLLSIATLIECLLKLLLSCMVQHLVCTLFGLQFFTIVSESFSSCIMWWWLVYDDINVKSSRINQHDVILDKLSYLYMSTCGTSNLESTASLH